MFTVLRSLLVPLILLAACLADVEAQGPPPGKGPRRDQDFMRDRDLFHDLLDNRAKITRKVTNTKKGVETVTESDDAKVVAMIQAHVKSMYKRIKEGNPIHMRDPLFAALFRNAGKITMKIENTKKGVKVVESSEDAYVVKLIQDHAKVVSLFLKNGHAEVRKNHALPRK